MFETILAFLRDRGTTLILALSVLMGMVGWSTTPTTTTTTPPPAQTVAREEEAAPTSPPTVAEVTVKEIPTPAPTPKPIATPPPTLPPTLPQKTTEEINTLARNAMVNLLCMTASGGPLNALSGSGILIDSRGVILTNAHVAQYWLLHNYPNPGSVDCVVRAGSPASPKYRAKLLFISPAWVKANAEKITESAPTGTGENDYALLLIDAPVVSGDSLPSSFPALSVSTTEMTLRQPLFLAAYPAGFLDGITISMNLYIASALSEVQERYTFGNTANIDLISVGGTIVSQGGSSGGAVIETVEGSLVGLIVTATAAETTAERDLRALTLSHINRSLFEAGAGGLEGLLTGDIRKKAEDFNANEAPALINLLVEAIN